MQEGYCLTCARELHIQPVDDLMKRFNMTDDQLASMEEHMADLMQQAQESGAMMPMMDGDMQNPDDTGDDFVPGGSPVFPFGFGGTPKAEEKGEKSKKQRGRGQRKYLDTYCENLTQKAKDGKLDAIIAVFFYSGYITYGSPLYGVFDWIGNAETRTQHAFSELFPCTIIPHPTDICKRGGGNVQILLINSGSKTGSGLPKVHRSRFGSGWLWSKIPACRRSGLPPPTAEWTRSSSSANR